MDVKLFECKGCRQKKDIVKHIKGLSYCHACASKAPTHQDYYKWIDEKSELLTNNEADLNKLQKDKWELK